ncbi:leucyl aminopeptidase [Xenorhabdus sp. IM139775]|uniref:leucyl aminopeptidase n=1 Tax=Xenorhabdus sp. IM139775 TaxID=3025876 RepID=UPI002359D98B|nr:leucyl aminopeptidase [Xenorhabdus sp. IM139775]MDC9594197.1 leucyl aminopeptidase [Xenorhabdus sp. IM139775]
MLSIDEKNESISNMFSNLLHHPSIKEKRENGEVINLLIGWDKQHRDIIENISSATTKFSFLETCLLPLDSTSSTILIEHIEKCDIFMFLYLSSTLKPFTSSGPNFLSPIRQVMQKNWRKSIILKDYGEHFYEAFSEQIKTISNRNQLLINLAIASKHVIFEQENDCILTATINENQSWTSIDGRDNYDITPGEIATKLYDLEGCVTFSGAFLSVIPFAIKYGVVQDFFKIKIKNSQIIDFTCHDPTFSQDFDKYLSSNPSNSVIEEFGIGTNCGVKRLYGLNAGFEERHPGLHLGLGGGAMGSHHLDLIFQGGSLSFDKTKFFHNELFNI